MQAVAIEHVPLMAFEDFRQAFLKLTGQEARLVALLAHPLQGTSPYQLLAVLALAGNQGLALLRAGIEASYPALTPDFAPAHWFEREIAEGGVQPVGHPWLKPVRNLQTSDFYTVAGPEIHEVAVGPVHAGIIEPGHFRFQCHGERVLHLEISLGYQHRGLEKALEQGPGKRTLALMETAAGDTSAGHTSAYCQLVEALSGTEVPPRALWLRAIALELERLANHTGDLGALAGDVGFLPTAAYCGRLRGDFLNMTAELCGNRFSRGLIRPGGTGFDISAAQAGALAKQLRQIRAPLGDALGLLFATPSVLARFAGTGALSQATARELGLVGLAARACGLNRDIRSEFPTGLYRLLQLPISLWHSGDVFGRAYVRWQEIRQSLDYLQDILALDPPGTTRQELGPLQPNSLAVSLVEGWRGEICHIARTDSQGRFMFYRLVDPSCHNWMGLAQAMRGQQISDFPLCNKSFNLSYCGHDL